MNTIGLMKTLSIEIGKKWDPMKSVNGSSGPVITSNSQTLPR